MLSLKLKQKQSKQQSSQIFNTNASEKTMYVKCKVTTRSQYHCCRNKLRTSKQITQFIQ